MIYRIQRGGGGGEHIFCTRARSLQTQHVVSPKPKQRWFFTQHTGNWGQLQGAAGTESHKGLQGFKVNPLRIPAHTSIIFGPRNLQLETATGQGSIQWEQHPVLFLSLHSPGHLLLAQGIVLSEPPGTGATAPPAPHTGVIRSTRGLLSQSTYPGTAIHAGFFSLHSHNCQGFGLSHFEDVRSTCTNARRFVLAQQKGAALEAETRSSLPAALQALTPKCWWEEPWEPAVCC